MLEFVLSASQKDDNAPSNSTGENETSEAEAGINFLSENSVQQTDPQHTDDCIVSSQQIDSYTSMKEDS